MASALAKEKGFEWTVDYIADLWYASKLRIEDLEDRSICEGKYSNRDIANCKHVERIFGDGRTRVPNLDPQFYERVCKRSLDAVTKHPVLVIGNWRQGKSTLVNSLAGKEVARTGRHQKTTHRVELHPIHAGSMGEIFLADTPGLEPDTEHDIIKMYREALKKQGSSPDVLTDTIVLVIAGTPQGISSLTSDKVMSWIRETYAKARGLSCGSCTILPVITHGDHIDDDEKEADKRIVRDRLQELEAAPKGATGAATACQTCAYVMEPIIICNPDEKKRRVGWGVDEVHKTIVAQVEKKSSSEEFKLQWSGMLTSDLRANVEIFQGKFPNDETAVRLFHRTVEATLATYGKQSHNIDTALPNASWHLLDIIERRLRKEENWKDRALGQTMALLPCSPREACPLFWAAGGILFVRNVSLNRSRYASFGIGLLKKVAR